MRTYGPSLVIHPPTLAGARRSSVSSPPDGGRRQAAADTIPDPRRTPTDGGQRHCWTSDVVYRQAPGANMVAVVGLLLLLVAVMTGIVGMLDHAADRDGGIVAIGHHVDGSTGAVVLFGLLITAVAIIGLSVLLGAARRALTRGPKTRHEPAPSGPGTALENQDSDPVEHLQQVGTDPRRALTTHRAGRWTRPVPPPDFPRREGHTLTASVDTPHRHRAHVGPPSRSGGQRR